MAASRKKVIVRQFDSTLTWGYALSAGLVQEGLVEILDPAGKASSLQISNIKHISYVKDFNLDDLTDPERIGKRSFIMRPRMLGLWLKLEFRDGDMLEGLAQFDTALLDSVLHDHGFAVSPPEGRSNTYRLFVPRSALTSVQVLGAITPPVKRPKPEALPTTPQPGLFEE